MITTVNRCILFVILFTLTACAGAMRAHDVYRDPNMDFGSIQTAAVMPFVNLSRDQLAGDRVRDVFITMLLSTGSVYVLPPGEISRGILQAGIVNPGQPDIEETKRFAAAVKADVVITGVIREYGEVRAGQAAANMISVSLQLVEAKTGRTVWSASTTEGGIGLSDRLFGGGGKPMNGITQKAVNDLLDKLFK